jgi:c-di-GMP-related signal transduction protein
MRGKSLTALHLASLQILQGLSDPNLSIAQVEHLIKRDAAVAYRILRFANSAAAAQTREVTSMQHALLLVGRDMVRRWASVAILTGLGTESPDELLTMAIVRARFAEILGEAIAGDTGGGEGFLVGLCSLLDVILGRAMADILDDLPLTADVRAALFGRDNHLRRLLDCVVAYERGDWSNCLALAGLAGLAPRSLAPAYLEALRFAYDLKQG